jgi:hypothetical protein
MSTSFAKYAAIPIGGESLPHAPDLPQLLIAEFCLWQNSGSKSAKRIYDQIPPIMTSKIRDAIWRNLRWLR